MVRQSGNTLINNKSWAQIVMGSGVQQKLQQNNLQSKKAQSKTQKKQQAQTQRTNTQQLKQVKQYLDKSKTTVKQNKKFVSTTQYPRSISSAQLKALQQEYQGLCNLFNANNYFGKSVYSQKKAWIQTKGRNVISVASCYSLRHKPVQNLIRPQQKKAMKNGGLKFTPKQNKMMMMKKNQKNLKNNKSQQPKFGESKQSNWGTEKAWGKNQPKQIREPPKEQAMKQQQMKQQQQQMEKIQQRHRKQMELLQKAQLKQQELLLKKQTEQRKKLLQYQKQQKMRLQSQTNQRSAPVRKAQAPVKVLRTVNQKVNVKQAKPLRHRLEAVRKQNQFAVNDNFKYTLNQLVDAMNYYPKKSYSSDRAWKYNKFLGGFFSSASYFAEKNAPFVPSSRPKVNVTNGLPVYTFTVKPTTKNVITPYNSNLQGVRTEGNGRYFEHWHIGSIWTHYYSKPKARRV